MSTHNRIIAEMFRPRFSIRPTSLSLKTPVVRTSNRLALLIQAFVVVLLSAVMASAAEPISEDRLRQSAASALQIIEHSSAVYLRERECFSCHHQAMPIATLMLAREKNLKVDYENLAKQVARSIEHLQRGEETYRQGKGQGGGVDTAGYALMGLAVAGFPPNKTTDAVVEYLLRVHAESRHWKCSSNRPPTEVSDITSSALALLGLSSYGDKRSSGTNPDGDPPEVSDSQRIAKRRADCQKWFASHEPADTEERVFRLIAAQSLDEPDVVLAMRRALLDSQREDGGWAQTQELTSDAYATGTAMVALVRSGFSTSETAYRRGLEYLLQRQLEDGSWHVKTRSKPIQKYFESGFPHGVDQFISISATCWSSMAVMLALPKSEATDRLATLPWQSVQSLDQSPPQPAKRPPATPEQIEFFEKEIRPLLVENCASCHGAEKQSGGLRVDQIESLLAGGDSGPALKPGSPSESLLIRAVKRGDELKMPPEDPLPAGKIANLERWVEMGAPWPEKDRKLSIDDRKSAAKTHWAFQPVRDHALPEVKHQQAAINPIDRFVLAKLEQQDLAFSPPAERTSWLRRVSYDLIGLPPTAQQQVEFASDDSPDAYERQVDRLLSSPRFGEHWGRKWLDGARYSDSKGYVYAREERFYVHAPTYRDWVIAAFSSDMPYDRFVSLQLAADQVAPDDPLAQSAMGYLTIGRRFLGVTHDIIDDRIDVVTRGLLGLTVGCARCHDHKFDPIPSDDYYSMYGVFMNTTEQRVRLPYATDPSSERLKNFNEELEKRQQKLRDQLAQERDKAGKRVVARLADYLMAQREMEKVPTEGFDIIIGPNDLVPAQVRRFHFYLLDAADRQDPIFSIWRLFDRLPADRFASLAADVVKQIEQLQTQPINPLVARQFRHPPTSMREVAERYASLIHNLHNIECVTQGEVDALRELQHFLTAADSPCIVPNEDIVSIEQFFESRICEAMWKLQGEVDRWIIQSSDSPAFATVLVDRANIREPFVFRRGNPLLITHRVPRQFLSAISVHSPASSSQSLQGASTSEQPTSTPAKPFRDGSGRRELAESIVDRNNPLTSRVWVNRIWQNLFGQGLVTTASDFGIRAVPPSHPELLDRLAQQLWEDEGSAKQIIRRIVLSATYRQSSSQSDRALASAAQERDPDNRLLWHAPIRRLSFEQQRDTWLQVAEALDNTRGGRARSMFSDKENHRRSVYGEIDRQFLPGVLRVFDFANPDLHTPARSETIVPQQALFELNHSLTARIARRVAQAAERQAVAMSQADQRLAPREAMVRGLFHQVLSRQPSPSEIAGAVAFLDQPADMVPRRRPQTDAWQYGYGKLDSNAGQVLNFRKLPHFDGQAWQGGPKWPDPKLGWAQLTATGGHAGNDLEHAVVRRWQAPTEGSYRVASTLLHKHKSGDGIHAAIVLQRAAKPGAPSPPSGATNILHSFNVHNGSEAMNIDRIELKQGDLLDFVVDFRENLNNDQFEWVPVIERVDSGNSDEEQTWSAEVDFAGPSVEVLTAPEQLAQVLLISNELIFID